MPASRFVIDAFKELPGIAEIIALGRVRRQPDTAVEPQIEVLLASDISAADFDPDADVHQRWVACGQLDLLTIGSRWQRRALVGQAQEKRYSGSFLLDDIEPLGRGADSPTRRHRPMPTRLMAEAPCFLLERSSPADSRDDPKKVLLPQMELIRALFGVSSRLLVELIDGLRDPTVADRGIVDRSKSELLPDGTVRLTCWRKPTDGEALILAAMIATPSLMRLHNEVFQQLVVQKGFREDKPTWPKVSWPFAQPICLTFEGRWFEREDGFNRFIATRITAIELQLSFNRIEVHHPGAGTEQDPDRMPPPTGRMHPANAKLVVLTTGHAPSPSRRSVEITSASVEIPSSKVVAIDFVAMGGPPRPRTSTLGEDPREEGEFSSAGYEAGADPKIGRAVVRRMVSDDASSVATTREQALRATWNALVTIATTAGWTLTPYPIAGSRHISAHDSGFDFRSEGIIASLDVGGRHVIVVDERTAPDDHRSLGILVMTTKRSMTPLDIQTIRTAHGAVRGHWGNRSAKVNGFMVFTVRRGRKVMLKSKVYADLLERKIVDAVARTC